MDKLEIANLALAQIGSGRMIASLDENSNEAKFCKMFIDRAITSVLREHTWNFAASASAMTLADDTVPTLGFLYVYRLPADYIRPFGVIPQDYTTYNDSAILSPLFQLGDPIHFEISGAFLRTNEPNAILKYVRATEEFTQEAEEALAARLALYLAMPMTRKPSLANSVKSEYAILLEHAKDIDANDVNLEYPTDFNDYITPRTQE